MQYPHEKLISESNIDVSKLSEEVNKMIQSFNSQTINFEELDQDEDSEKVKEQLIQISKGIALEIKDEFDNEMKSDIPINDVKHKVLIKLHNANRTLISLAELNAIGYPIEILKATGKETIGSISLFKRKFETKYTLKIK